MKPVTVFVAVAIGWFFNAAAPLYAQTDDEIMAAYKAYNAAIEAGDGQAALEQSRLAYELAETVWGDSRKDTALLAINYADQLYEHSNLRAASEIYQRCIELLRLRIEESRFNLGYCYFKYGSAIYNNGRNRQKAKSAYLSAVETFSPLVETDLDAAAYAGQSYLALAGLNTPRTVRASSPEKGAKKLARRLEESRDYAKAAQPLLIRALGEDALIVGHAYFIEGIYHEWARDWKIARDLYEKATDIFEMHLGADHLDSRRAFGRYIYADALVRRKENADKISKEPSSDGCYKMESDNVEIEICPIKRRPPTFPQSTAFKGQSGFALIEYDIDETGSVLNLKIIESWPGDEFDKATLREARRWKFKPPVTSDGDVVVATGVQTFITFELEW